MAIDGYLRDVGATMHSISGIRRGSLLDFRAQKCLYRVSCSIVETVASFIRRRKMLIYAVFYHGRGDDGGIWP